MLVGISVFICIYISLSREKITIPSKGLTGHKTLQVIETHRGVNAFKCDMTKLWGSAVEAEFLAEILFDYTHISSPIDNIQRSSVLAISVNNNSVKQVKKAIDIARPLVLLLLSDEWEDKKEYEELFSKVPLVYRQYRYDSYKNPSNQRILPLGYHCWDQHARRPSMPKKYIWSFIGSPKGRRKKDLEILDKLRPNFHGETKQEQNPDILNSSIFVYCPIGNYNVECSRQYTASMCGAIPCIVCTQSQWDSTYPHFDIEPPWLHADSAEKIRDMMEELLKNPDELNTLQQAVSKWWVDIKRALYENINNVVTNTIPHIIHQTVPDKTNISPIIQKTIDNLKNMNPGWDHVLYDDEDIEDFIKEYYPRIMDTYMKINPDYGPARSDLFRYLVIYKFGGVYLDCKSSVSKPLDNILRKDDSFVYQVSSYMGGNEYGVKDIPYFNNHEINQWFIISIPENPLLKSVIDQTINNIHDPRMHNYTGKLGVLRMTGPIMYTNTIAPLLKFYPSRRILPDGIENGGLVYTYMSTQDYRSYSSKPHYSTLNTPIIL